MFLKLMEGEGGFRMIEVSEVAFRRYPEPTVLYKNGTGVEIAVPLCNHAFLVNENGDTIESFYVRGRKA